MPSWRCFLGCTEAFTQARDYAPRFNTLMALPNYLEQTFHYCYARSMSRSTALTALSPIASEQWGMVTTGQVRRLGVSRTDLHRLLVDGVLTESEGAARVYQFVATPLDPDFDPLRAAWLQLGGERYWHERIADIDAVVAGRSAARVWGLGDLIPKRHQFLAPRRLRPRRTDIHVSVRATLCRDDFEIRDGLPVTNVLATITDLVTAGEDESALAQIATDALTRGLVTRQAVAALLPKLVVA